MQKVLRRVLGRCLVVGLGRSIFTQGFLEEGSQKDACALLESTTPEACAPLGMAILPVSRVNNPVLQGLESRSSLISVP